MELQDDIWKRALLKDAVCLQEEVAIQMRRVPVLEWAVQQTVLRVHQDWGQGRAQAVLGRVGSRGRAGSQAWTLQLGGSWRGLA